MPTIEEVLKEEFDDTLGKEDSQAAIMVFYKRPESPSRLHLVLGFPYDIKNGTLTIGPYEKNTHLPVPRDYYERKQEIPVEDISTFIRVDSKELRAKAASRASEMLEYKL